MVNAKSFPPSTLPRTVTNPQSKEWLADEARRQPHARYAALYEEPLEITPAVNRLAKEVEPDEACGGGMPFGSSKTRFIVCYAVFDGGEEPASEYAIFDTATNLFAHTSELSKGEGFTWGRLEQLRNSHTAWPLRFDATASYFIHLDSVCTTNGACVQVPEARPLGFLHGERYYLAH